MYDTIPVDLFCELPLSSVVLCLAEVSSSSVRISRSVLRIPSRNCNFEKNAMSTTRKGCGEHPRDHEFEFEFFNCLEMYFGLGRTIELLLWVKLV